MLDSNMPDTIQPIDIIILSNGPGEVTTWVRPVVRALRAELVADIARVRISAILSPCPNASGKEVQILASYPEIDRVQGAEHFTNFLVWGKTANGWDWRSKGIIIFLGGDQFFPVVIGQRLGYQTVVYAEWDARWHNLIDRFAVMNAEVMAKVQPQYLDRFTIVGDLMVESQNAIDPEPNPAANADILIGLLPGSKSAKLGMGLPLMLAIAEYIQATNPRVKFAIPVAPTLDLATLASYADPTKNPVIALVNGATATLEHDGNQPYLKTSKGLTVSLHTEFPAHDLLSQCTLCLTTIGANTAELGALGVPMIVLIATQQIDAMRAWDGALGILVNLPVVGTPIAKIINSILYYKFRDRKLSWPNIWAQQREIVPELLGRLDAKTVANFTLDYLEHPEKLAEMKAELRQVRGAAGAADKLAAVVAGLVE
ncbi:lipid-A-disaccharide synthase [Chamaesiphon sp. OTE_20_metabat_361]|uniref:lipid-A-disaccharide synthase n=1 Tax=Chamaesiphon sp. OTE_20_metabat_361 TaxID=2964689 RepID=UPI00286B8698|nr:lipid-A-disaccharide synthase [Chamaesiphon sp. OTE_20_metabat_361]